MEWLEFIAAIANAVSWPIAVIVGSLVFKGPLLKLLGSISKVSHGDTAIEFDRNGKEVSASLVSQEALPAPQKEAVTSLASENIGKIVNAWKALEDIIRQKLTAAGVEPPGFPFGTTIIVSARNNGLITAEQANSLRGLYRMRNLAVHGRDEIDDARTTEFLVLTDAMRTVLEATETDFGEKVGNHIAAGIYGQGEVATMDYDALSDRLAKDYGLIRQTGAGN